MKNYLRIFSLSMLLAHASSGIMNHSELDKIDVDLQGSKSGFTRVWIEKSARRASGDAQYY